MEHDFHKMIEPVARQMCILAGFNPDMMVHVPPSWVKTRVEMLTASRTYFPGRGVYVPPVSQHYQNEVRMEVFNVPAFRSDTDGPDIPISMWQMYRGAAYDAILGGYAVKQVLLAGKEVPK